MNKFEIGDNGKNGWKKWLVGVDEVGRGPLAGPVTVSAVAIPYLGNIADSYFAISNTLKASAGREYPIGVDSKKMKESDREFWHGYIGHAAEAGNLIANVEHASAAEIDAEGIAVCIRRLVDANLIKVLQKIQEQIPNALDDSAEIHLLLDGSLSARVPVTSQKIIIKGDEKEMVISLASVFAKVTRDRHMKELSKNPKYSAYGFEVHKGYGTAKHRAAMKETGLSDEHRRSFCGRF